jgi:hypothetical protein
MQLQPHLWTREQPLQRHVSAAEQHSLRRRHASGATGAARRHRRSNSLGARAMMPHCHARAATCQPGECGCI